ncbi:MAG TPA: outer membrane lipoprotein carrier protein LolA [Longimicrobiales bacterium]
MNRFVVVLAVLGAGCGGEETDAPRSAAPAAPAAEMPDTTPVQADTALPPGLAPVAIDEDLPARTPRDTARRPAQPPAQAPPVDTGAPAATPRDEGAAVLRRAATAYESVRSMQAAFVMHFDNPLLRQQTTSRGTLYQQRPDRIALRFSDPEGDVILSDGESFYVYQPSVDAHQATRTPAAPGGGGGVDLQAQFVGNPVERFRYTLHGTESVGGREAHVMTLVPLERAEYRSLKVWFDTRDSLARRFEITEHNGSVRRFDLSELRTNATIPADIFRFTPPSGVRIVNVG